MNDKSAPLPVSSTLFALAFRPLFLGAAALSVLSLLIWGLALYGWQFKPYGGVQFWHGHEMLFGFVGAVIVGFLLTAVQSWTGLRSVNGRPLIYLLLLWLFARVLMAVPLVPEMLIVFVDLLFFPAAAMFLFIPLLVRNQTRNYFAVLALFLLMICNGLS
ncbi:MAG TPA: NnrS family protein, partial [Methylotenera sp.]|nr:NnrS family protein [Methylotenera sp.]